MVELFAPFTGPPDAEDEFWRQGLPVLKYLDWRAIAMGCRVSSMCSRRGFWQPLSCAAGTTWPRSPMRSETQRGLEYRPTVLSSRRNRYCWQ
eukprot:2359478-Amphidinium_carterae.1